ncbi:MAG: NACHT domain-containing protein [Cyanothece sp. SIO1E1]|nr:NACHT domain-containing protein [Cyanothece sp. SIO1E1]
MPLLLLLGLVSLGYLVYRWFRKNNYKTGTFRKLRWSREHQELAQRAKEAVGKGSPKDAIKLLTKIEDERLQEEVVRLSSRWNKYSKDKNRGILGDREEQVAFNKISDSVLSLIKQIESVFEEEDQEHSLIFHYLTDRYSDRLNQKLKGRQPITLPKRSSTVGTDPETSEAFISGLTFTPDSEVYEIFQEAQGRLLIVGKPGSGKTCTLLQLALQLVDQEQFTLPVLLNLASWRSSYQQIDQWLKDILPMELAVPAPYANDLLQMYDPILLLDGLDEIPQDHRNSFLEALGRYGAHSNRQYAISSRTEEYRSEEKDAPVYAQIEIDQITSAQLSKSFQEWGHSEPEARPLLQALEKEPILKEVIRIPFYLNLLQLLFAQGKRLSEMNLRAGTVEEVRTQLIHYFVDNQLKFIATENKQAIRWLSFLAQRMEQYKLVAFELRDLQFDWWPWSKWSLFIGGFIYGFFIPFLFGLGFQLLTFTLGDPVLASFQEWLVFGGFTLVFGLFSGLLRLQKRFPRIPDFQISTKERINFSWPRFFELFFSYFIFFLFIGLIAILGGWLKNQEDILWALVAITFMSVLFSFIYILQEEHSNFVQINHPYQRFYASAQRLHFSISLHFLLRFQLFWQGALPWKLVPFLNEMKDYHILESDGASWRFRHRLMQEYFMASFESPENSAD